MVNEFVDILDNTIQEHFTTQAVQKFPIISTDPDKSIAFKEDENSTLALDADDIDNIETEGDLDEDNTNYSDKDIPDFIDSDSESDEDDDSI